MDRKDSFAALDPQPGDSGPSQADPGTPVVADSDATDSLLSELERVLPGGAQQPATIPATPEPTCPLASSGEWWVGLSSQAFLEGLLQRVSGCCRLPAIEDAEIAGQASVSFEETLAGFMEEVRAGGSCRPASPSPFLRVEGDTPVDPPPPAPASAVDPPPGVKLKMEPQLPRRRLRWDRLGGLVIGLLIVVVAALWTVISATVSEADDAAAPAVVEASPTPAPSYNPVIQRVFFGRR